MSNVKNLLEKDIVELLEEIEFDIEIKNIKVEAVIHYKIIQQYLQLFKDTSESATKQAKKLTCATWVLVFSTIGLIVATILTRLC